MATTPSRTGEAPGPSPSVPAHPVAATAGGAPEADRRRLVHRALGDASRVRVWEALRASADPLDARELAGRVSLHPNTVRAHLDVLAAARLVTSGTERRQRRGRPRVVFSATEPPAGDGGYRLLAEVLAASVAERRPVEEAGRVRGRMLVESGAGTASGTDLARLVELLGRFGFAPDAVSENGGAARIRMRRCPFAEAARAHAAVVCPAHLGLIRGALEGLAPGLEATRIEPFVEPELCVLHLRRRDVAGRPGEVPQ